MARINLLPWREELRQEKKKEFITQLVGVCILALLVSYLWVQSVDSAVTSQKSRNNILQSEIDLLSKQVIEIKTLKKERRALLDRMRVIQDLEGKRSIIVHYFDEFTRAVPDGVFVTSFSRKGDLFTIEGVSESNNRIADFMRQLADSDWFSEPNMKFIKTEEEILFAMDVKAVLPDDEDNKDG